ncbi:MAG: hopanoid biosynthesis-associated protein HpnK [Thermoleophilia bacterium]|nr:hopanoid biosynthesis-associated protein HpnK [Thermoleophilia bacterium]
MVRLVVNADDFGRSESVNQAVIQAHREGIVTSASLMVTGKATAQAVELARANPGLGVGLHIVLTRGRAVLPPEEIPHLVDKNGNFAGRPVLAGLRYFFSRRAQRELAKELEAQFEAFLSTGLTPSHVDSHHHIHLHPKVLKVLLALAQKYGGLPIRTQVADNLFLSLRHERRYLVRKLLWKVVYSILGFLAAARARRAGLPTARRTFGLMQSGRLTQEYLVDVVKHLAQYSALSQRGYQVFEIYCHPSLIRESPRFGPNPGDLAAVTSPKLSEKLGACGVRLTNYWCLKQEDRTI